ncbi:MAG TPA: adenylate/guanylate cyclase domain-containing protein [Saprospiraceae bacterium]|nr:adenylate/guanylate cyclase domain-containing protein [Saprospiraceae bacterium]
MRTTFLFFFLLVCALEGSAQQLMLDSLLRMEKQYQKEDSVRAKLLTDIARRYYTVDPSKGVPFAEKAIKLSEKLPDKKFLAGAYSSMGGNMLTLADYPAALTYYQRALEINQKLGNQQGIANNYNNIGLVYYSIFDYPKALEYYQRNLQLNEQTGNKSGIAGTLGNIGAIYNVLKDYPNAIAYYERALLISEKEGNQQQVAGTLSNLGNVYTHQKAFSKALDYKQRALSLYEKLGNQSGIATNLGNIGNVYRQMQDYPAAIQYHEKALVILDKIKDKKAAAAGYASLGEVYYLQKNYPKALQLEQQALAISSAAGLVKTTSESFLHLSKIYEAQGRFDSAYWTYGKYIDFRDSISSIEKQTELTKKTLQFEFSRKEDSLRQYQALTDARLQQQILLAAKQQKELELQQSAIRLATKEKEIQHLAYLKSQADLQFEQSTRRENEEKLRLSENEKQLQATQMSLQETQLQLKDKEIRSRETQSLFYVGGIILLTLLSFFIFRNFLNQQKANKIIRKEKQKSEDLLHNILPEEVADELKVHGQAMARQFDHVTVLFTDFVNFTSISEQLPPQELVNTLHQHFRAFDEIMDKYGLEKIKTIGDAYMAVAGLPVPASDHAIRAARAALDIQAYIVQNLRQNPSGFQIRIGLHSGPVVAGIVGVKKFAYDIWGDTVNTASRMESSSEPGKINLSEATHQLLKGQFRMESRGAVAAKHKGEIDMYFLLEWASD